MMSVGHVLDHVPDHVSDHMIIGLVATALQFTEAEFLAISQTAKEAIYLSRLMHALNIVIPKVLNIECKNTQTIQLLVDESIKLQTKLRHVDMHSY